MLYNRRLAGFLGIFILMLSVLAGPYQSDVYAVSSKNESDKKDPKVQPVVANEYDRKDFEKGYHYFEKEDYEAAAPYFYRFVKNHTADDEDYEWAEFFLAISLAKTGFSHASVDILSMLVTRKPNQKIVTYALEVFETIVRTKPFDRELVINQAICDQDYGFVDGRLSNFIHYYQGVYDWQHGFFEWGDGHFRNISKESYYYYKYLYQKAKQELHNDKIDEAIATLKTIMVRDVKETDLKDDVRKMLARLLYEKEDFKAANRLYQDIEQNILDQSQNLMELAWVQYRQGNPEKAMGLLYAFEAPSFKNSFTPEYFILKSFIYKDVCHYQRALDVVEDFRARYGDALTHIYNRKEPITNEALILVLLGKKQINDTFKFLNLLTREKEKVKGIKDSVFQFYMNRLYDLKIRESAETLRNQIQESYEEMANELLKYEEEAYLMAYEIGLDMYQRVTDHHYAGEENKEQKSDKGIVVYPFQGEFWNDELSDYHVSLPDKCNQMEEWDIFFK
ncbi:MAG: hypothetical protein KJ737_26810 [Proteobacteria bacterium]|nr:hypothetical protein [Pseudomonadota bacterium]